MEGLGGACLDGAGRCQAMNFSRRALSGRLGSQHASGGAGRPRRLTHGLTDDGWIEWARQLAECADENIAVAAVGKDMLFVR